MTSTHTSSHPELCITKDPPPEHRIRFSHSPSSTTKYQTCVPLEGAPLDFSWSCIIKRDNGFKRPGICTDILDAVRAVYSTAAATDAYVRAIDSLSNNLYSYLRILCLFLESPTKLYYKQLDTYKRVPPKYLDLAKVPLRRLRYSASATILSQVPSL
jgi:hypothetical protein